MSGPAIVAMFMTVSFGLVTLACSAAHAVEVRAIAKQGPPAMSGLWLRIFDEALFDPRFQRLPASLFQTWFNVLCATSRNAGTIPDLPELAFMLRTRPGALSRRLEALKAAGLIEEIDGELRPVAWEKRQFVERPADPTAAERMRRFRERAAERNGP